MRLRPHVVLSLVRKDLARLIRNGPALMLLGLFVVASFLLASSGLVEERQTQQTKSAEPKDAAWIVYWQDSDWIQLLRRRAPREMKLRFVPADEVADETYPPHLCVIEIRKPVLFQERQQTRHHVQYRYPGSDPNVLWPVTRWFLAVSLEYFGQTPFFETIKPLDRRPGGSNARARLESVSVADILDLTLIGTVLLTTIQFFAACGLMVSLTAQERERGALRALLLTPATYFEFVLSKMAVHGGLAVGTSAVAVAALQPAVLTSLLFWGTMITLTCGYFAVGLLIASFAKTQTAPNLLSFAYILVIGTLNFLAFRFEVFQKLSLLTFERYGLVLTIASLNAGALSVQDSLNAMRSSAFRMLFLLSGSLFLIAFAIGSRRLQRQ